MDKKVYCKGCKWLNEKEWTLGGDRKHCSHEENKYIVDTPYEECVCMTPIRVCNENNNCKLFEEKKRFSLFKKINK